MKTFQSLSEMYGSVSGPGGGTGGYWWLFSPNSEPNCIRDKVNLLLGRCIIHADISAARTQDEGVNIDVWKKSHFFPVTVISSRPHPRFWNPMGVGRPLSIFRITLWSSEGDINLTLRLWAFICLWELRSTAQTTVTILQIPLYTTLYTQNTHTHTRVLTHQSSWACVFHSLLSSTLEFSLCCCKVLI